MKENQPVHHGDEAACKEQDSCESQLNLIHHCLIPTEIR
jgi:hypothetical protein